MFNADDALVFITALCRLLESQGVRYQAAQGGRQLVERRFAEGFFVQLREDCPPAQQHVRLQFALEPLELAGLPLVMSLAQVGFFPAPFAQGFDRDFQHIADQSHIAIVPVDLVEGVDFRVQRISPHGLLLWARADTKRCPKLALRPGAATACSPSAFGHLFRLRKL